MKYPRINIACGDSYIDGHSPAVSQANLLKRLPVSDGVAEVVYSSHFMEHIPRKQVLLFLSECFRITKSGGHVRLALPDLQELCRAYLAKRERDAHEKADFVVLEMVDQCVRSISGGELGDYYDRLQAAPQLHKDMIEYIRKRTGHVIQSSTATATGSRWFRLLQNPKKLLSKLTWWYCQALLVLLPSAFRQQNVSLTTVGERHAWIYDFYTVDKLLRQVRFVDVQRMTATTSNISNFPFYPLDVTEDELPRKGRESMYVEVLRP